MAENKKILIVDDSAFMRKVLCDIINEIEGFEVAKACKDGLEALDTLLTDKYDAMILDVEMPRMDGIELLHEIQKRGIDITTLMSSTYTTENAAVTIRCMELGAIDFVTKPYYINDVKGEKYKAKIERMLKTVFMSDLDKVKSVSAMKLTAKERYEAAAQRLKTAQNVRADMSSQGISLANNVATEEDTKDLLRKDHKIVTGNRKIVAIACSTGGPKSLQSVIPFLDEKIDAPVLIVQHMPVGFTKSLADRLNEISKITVTEACDGEIIHKGHVYIAPGGKHLEIIPEVGGAHRVHLSDLPPIGGLKPCANVMYKSLASCRYDEIVCAVLTGMGADGTEGITYLDKEKPVYVIGQNAQSSIVYGMPKAIAEAGMADEILPLENVAAAIIKHVGLQK